MLEFVKLVSSSLLIGIVVGGLSVISVLLFAPLIDEAKELKDDYVEYDGEKIPYNEDDQE